MLSMKNKDMSNDIPEESNEEMSDEPFSENEQMSNDEEMCNNEAIDSDIKNNKTLKNGWEDAVSKILHTNKPKKKKTLVLSRAKLLCDTIKKQTEEPLPFELEKDGEIRKEVIVKGVKDLPEHKRTVKKDAIKLRVKPNILDRERERMLQKIATKGVVQLFNAVRQQQSAIETKLKASGPLESKREKVLKSIDKNSFLDVLMGSTKSIEIDNSIKTVKKNEDTKKKVVWKVLRDDFVMNKAMKNWDKEDSNSEDEEEEENDIHMSADDNEDEDSDESS